MKPIILFMAAMVLSMTSADDLSRPGRPAAAEDLYVLAAVYYLESGRAFGSADYGFRFSQGFCDVQRSVLIKRWQADGAEPRGAHAVWLPSRQFAVRLFCVPLVEFEKDAVRRKLGSQPFSPD